MTVRVRGWVLSLAAVCLLGLPAVADDAATGRGGGCELPGELSATLAFATDYVYRGSPGTPMTSPGNRASTGHTSRASTSVLGFGLDLRYFGNDVASSDPVDDDLAHLLADSHCAEKSACEHFRPTT